LCYCLMGNHYHLLVKTPQANLGRAMRHKKGSSIILTGKGKKEKGVKYHIDG